MKQIMQDKYILGQSMDKQISVVGEEIRLDLKLTPNTNDLKGGKVSGKVSDINGTGIANALVKLMSTDYEPLLHVVTDANGNYSFANIAAGSYNIFSIAQGRKLKQGNQFSVTEMQSITSNFTLEEDPSMKLAIIAGDLINSTNNQPVGGAVVSLFLKAADGTESLEAVTYTNQYGQYVFREVPKGEYAVRISALGYNSVGASVSVTQDGQIVAMNVSITPNANTSKGTVSGIITNDQNQPVDRADVILYKVNANSSLTPVAFTKTNANGVYLFANVEQGTYKVKSNQIELVDVDVPSTWTYSPNFDYFSILNYGSLNVSATTATLENSAIIVPENPDYIGNIGNTGGTATLNINVPSAGDYIFGIQYLAGDNDRIMKIDVNNAVATQATTFPKTNGWYTVDSKILNLKVTLNQGSNTIKFYNSPNANGPWLGMLTFAKITSVSATTATLENGAIIVPEYPDYVGAIGETGGTATLTVNAPIAGNYVLGLQYLSGDVDRIIKIDVNRVYTGETYNFPKTNSWNPMDSKVVNVNIALNQGSNTIKFYNSPNAKGPWFGMITMSPVILITIYDATNPAVVTLEGSAKIENGIVTGVGANLGSLTCTVTVPASGIYNFGIGYVAADNSKVSNISVNGVPTNQTYTFAKTPGVTQTQTLLKIVPLTLNKGSNAIKIYNNL